MPTVDAKFGTARLAAVYDAVEGDREDLEAYRRIAAELGARRVLDLGCGTGVLALLLADDGLQVTGADPAGASLEVARGKPGADRVRWIDGDATAVPRGPFDLVTFTGNAAMAVIRDEEWAARAWEAWAAQVGVRRRVEAGRLETWTTEVRWDDPIVSFAETNLFDDGTRLDSRSRLRYRDRTELEHDLAAAGLGLREVRDAPDRPGLELVALATPSG